MFAPKLLKNDGQKECFSGNAGCTGRTTQGLDSIDPVYGKGLSLSGCSEFLLRYGASHACGPSAFIHISFLRGELFERTLAFIMWPVLTTFLLQCFDFLFTRKNEASASFKSRHNRLHFSYLVLLFS